MDMATATVKVEQISGSASRGNARGHELVMDRPEAKGGTNQGMMGGEAMLNGLGGCFMSNLLAAAKFQRDPHGGFRPVRSPRRTGKIGHYRGTRLHLGQYFAQSGRSEHQNHLNGTVSSHHLRWARWNA
jgi:hypothetical protein